MRAACFRQKFNPSSIFSVPIFLPDIRRQPSDSRPASAGIGLLPAGGQHSSPGTCPLSSGSHLFPPGSCPESPGRCFLPKSPCRPQNTVARRLRAVAPHSRTVVFRPNPPANAEIRLPGNSGQLPAASRQLFFPAGQLPENSGQLYFWKIRLADVQNRLNSSQLRR